MISRLIEIVSNLHGRLTGLSTVVSKAPRQSRRFRPVVGLERLEGRDVPSGGMGMDMSLGMTTNSMTITVTNQDDNPAPTYTPSMIPVLIQTPPSSTDLAPAYPPSMIPVLITPPPNSSGSPTMMS
jgi:hypothetical protein